MKVCVFEDCKFKGTPGCRVHDWGVFGVQECIKYKPKEGVKK